MFQQRVGPPNTVKGGLAEAFCFCKLTLSLQNNTYIVHNDRDDKKVIDLTGGVHSIDIKTEINNVSYLATPKLPLIHPSPALDIDLDENLPEPTPQP